MSMHHPEGWGPYPEGFGSSQNEFPEASSPGDFQFLCKVRRSFCQPEIINTLSIETIEEYAICLAQWELPRPLYDFETILKNKAVDKNGKGICTLIGAHLH